MKQMSTKPKVVVGSGWWSSKQPHRWIKGDAIATTPEFFSLWLHQVQHCLRPDRIVITDSCSPRKPNYFEIPNLVWVELDANYGHANDIRTGRVVAKFCGATRAMLNGAMYAICCDADYFVYVEQDCLLRGEGFLERAVGDSHADIFLGNHTIGGKGLGGKPAISMLQESFFIIKKEGLSRFVCATLDAVETDGELPPEKKKERDLMPFEFLKVPYGRSRPVDFSLDHYYVQHLTKEELIQFLEVEKIFEHPKFADLIGSK